MMTMSLAGVGRPFSVADLEAMPDDGRRYELIDGELLVTPAPAWAHQEAAITLTELLRSACPRDLRVLIAPFAVRPDLHNELQDRKSTRLNSSHRTISYAVFCLKKKKE